jgi:hypothetical protein
LQSYCKFMSLQSSHSFENQAYFFTSKQGKRSSESGPDSKICEGTANP